MASVAELTVLITPLTAICDKKMVVVRQIVVPCIKRISPSLAEALRLFGLGLQAESAKDARRTREVYLRRVTRKRVCRRIALEFYAATA
jgi:hypothetical protein